MIELGPEWKTYYPGERVKCPGHRLGIGRRRETRGAGDRRQECRRVFARVGTGELWHIRWVGDKQHPMSLAVLGSTMECWDCHTLVEVKRQNSP